MLFTEAISFLESTSKISNSKLTKGSNVLVAKLTTNDFSYAGNVKSVSIDANYEIEYQKGTIIKSESSQSFKSWRIYEILFDDGSTEWIERLYIVEKIS